MTSWTIVTVTYNSVSQLRSCWVNTELDGVDWIVVDNASTDESVAFARELGANVISLDSNVGFSAANNVGLNHVSGEWVIFANPDIALSVDDLTRLQDVSVANGACLVAPQLLNPDGSEQPNGRGFPFVLDKFANRSVHLPGSRVREYVRTGLDRPTFVAWAMGAALAGPTHQFRQLGGWDESYFLYYEDHDIGLRAWQGGTAVVLIPDVRWMHLWRRETTEFSYSAWSREIASAITFYRAYPHLATRRLLHRSRKFITLQEQLWAQANDA